MAMTLRQRLRGPRRHGRQRRPDAQGLPRGRGLSGAVAHHRLQPLHRPRLRPAPRHGPAEGRRPLRLLAALPLQPRAGPRRARPARSSTRRRRACRSRSTPTTRRATRCWPTAIRSAARRLLEQAQEDVLARWRLYEQWAALCRVAPAGGAAMIDLVDVATSGCPCRTRWWPRRGPSARTSTTSAGWRTRGRRRWCCTRSSRSRSRWRATTSTAISPTATESYRGVADLLPGHAELQARPRRLSRAHPPGQGRGRHPGHRQPQRRLHRRLDRATRGRSRRPAPTRSS